MTILSAQFSSQYGDVVDVRTMDGSVLVALPPHTDNSGGWQAVLEEWLSVLDEEGRRVNTISPYDTPAPDCIELGRQAIAAVLPPDLLVACLSYLGMIPDRTLTPKLNALNEWQLSIQSLAASGQSTFPPAPFTYADILAECLPIIAAAQQSQL